MSDQTFEWLEEPEIKSHDETIDTVREWRDIARDLEPSNAEERKNKMEFLEASSYVVENPGIYDQELYHGTTMHPMDTLMEEMLLRPGSAKEREKSGEHQSLPMVSSTSNIYDAMVFALRYTPILPDVKNSVENDILGHELPEDVSGGEIKEIIGEALIGDREWLVRGEPYGDQLALFAQSGFSFDRMERWQERNYSMMYNRIEDIGEERDSPVVFGYSSESLHGNTNEVYTPLFQNELSKTRLSEIQSDFVELGADENAIYVNEDIREEFADREGTVPAVDTSDGEPIHFRYGDRLSVGSIEGLTLYQLARNSESYREHQVIRDDSPQWEGDLIIPQQDFREKKFDEHDLSANPYDLTIVG
jgi:hypothetical protein